MVPVVFSPRPKLKFRQFLATKSGLCQERAWPSFSLIGLGNILFIPHLVKKKLRAIEPKSRLIPPYTRSLLRVSCNHPAIGNLPTISAKQSEFITQNGRILTERSGPSFKVCSGAPYGNSKSRHIEAKKEALIKLS